MKITNQPTKRGVGGANVFLLAFLCKNQLKSYVKQSVGDGHWVGDTSSIGRRSAAEPNNAQNDDN